MPCSSDRKNPLTSLSPEQLKLLDQLGEGLTSEAQESLRARTPPEPWDLAGAVWIPIVCGFVISLL